MTATRVHKKYNKLFIRKLQSSHPKRQLPLAQFFSILITLNRLLRVRTGFQKDLHMIEICFGF